MTVWRLVRLVRAAWSGFFARVRRQAAGVLVLAVALLASVAVAQAETISGPAEVTKPYSFTLGDYEVFLLGVDSVEAKQTCTVKGRIWECWAAAQRQLQTILSGGDVTCESIVEDISPKRMIALCTLNGQDIGLQFVESGFGLALPEETTRYIDTQADARLAGIGLWQGTFTTPSIWRNLPIRPKSNRPSFDGQPIN
jgi:endonuclease YncB( thermonuclease family)